MKGRLWLVLGVLVGIAIGVGHLPYLAGAARSLSDTALRLVRSGGASLVHSAASYGAARRVVEGVAAAIAVLAPGVTALLLVAAARLSIRLRVVIGLLVLALGIAGYHYAPAGTATGALGLAIVAAVIAVVATGPLVAAPLAALAGLIGTEFLPRLVSGRLSVPRSTVLELHEALFARAGAPTWLQVVVLVAAAVPFAVAARLVVR